MKYTLEIDIGLPRPQVVALFADPDNWPHWQKTLVRAEILEGTPGEAGARTKLIHRFGHSERFGRRETEMLETVESNRLPEEMTCIYTAPGAWNRVVNRFAETGPGRTRWEFESEFRCAGLLKVMALLAPGFFRRASRREMASFRQFAESRVLESAAR